MYLYEFKIVLLGHEKLLQFLYCKDFPVQFFPPNLLSVQ